MNYTEPNFSRISEARDVFRRTGLVEASNRTATPERRKVPPIRLASFDRALQVFTLVFFDGITASLCVDELEGVEGKKAIYWELDAVRTGVEIALEDGTVTSFSGDFALYLRDPEYRQWADKQSEKNSGRKLALRIARRVRAIREELGVSVAELSRCCGIAAPNLHRLEAASHVPTTATLVKVAEGLDVPVERLLAK